MRYLLTLSLLLLPFVSQAQLSGAMFDKGQGITIGLEKNSSVFLEYNWKQGFHVGAKHTVIVDKVEYQSLRIEGGYTWMNDYVHLDASPFVTSDWKGSFYNVGLRIGALSNYYSKYVRIGAEYVPYYDSDLKMQHGWAVMGQVNVTKEVALLAEYSRKPDYRIAYKRFYTGAKFHVKNLSVIPMLEVPIYDGGLHASHSSVVVNLAYTFAKR